MRNPPNETLTGQRRAPRTAGRQPDEVESNGHRPERTCILTRRTAAKDELVRLALGPDGQVAPDVRARAPGRGAWIGVDRPALDAAQAKGKADQLLTRRRAPGEDACPLRNVRF